MRHSGDHKYEHKSSSPRTATTKAQGYNNFFDDDLLALALIFVDLFERKTLFTQVTYACFLIVVLFNANRDRRGSIGAGTLSSPRHVSASSPRHAAPAPHSPRAHSMLIANLQSSQGSFMRHWRKKMEVYVATLQPVVEPADVAHKAALASAAQQHHGKRSGSMVSVLNGLTTAALATVPDRLALC